MAKRPGKGSDRPTWIALGGDAVKALLSAPALAKTRHFVLQAPTLMPIFAALSTDGAPARNDSVDIRASLQPLGVALVVPKRHAKRAVTRNLIKRHMREVLQRHVPQWRTGRLLIRQRAPFDPGLFRSAASPELSAVLRTELDQLLEQGLASQ
jgi:ribonuclease P protein component